MGEDNSSVAMPESAVTVSRKPGAQLALAMTVLALVLASNSIINDSWLTTSQELNDSEIVADYSLTELSAQVTGSEDIETESYASLYDECKDFDGAESKEACAKIKDFHDAGFVAIAMLILSAIILFTAAIFQVRSMIGNSSKSANFLSAIGGIFVGLSALVWSLMLPETDLNPEWGQGLWMVIIATIAGLIAGFSGTIQSWIDGPPRMRSHGVRSGTGMSEFVLKESSCGDHALSILVDSDLIRVVKVNRIGASASVKDVLATRRDTYTGFSHQRMDWLDDFKGLWWVLGGATLISSFMISTLFLIPFFLVSLLALLQLMDPERFVVSTNSGGHAFYINRWRSNRELTNLAMDLVDESMIAVLRGEDLDTEMLDARADLIAERFSAERDAKRLEIQAAAEEKEAFIQAANTPPAVPEPVVAEALPEPPAAISEETIVAETDQNQQSDEVEWPATESDETSGEKEPEQPQAMEPQAVNEESIDEPVVDEPVVDEPVVDEPVVSEPEAQTPLPPAPVAPPVVIPPPPPLPEIPPPVSAIPGPPAAMPLPAPPVAIPPPPAAIPPPAVGMPLPPPPSGAAILPPMINPQPIIPPPPVVVQAAPREDNLSDDEKDDLLGDLSA